MFSYQTAIPKLTGLPEMPAQDLVFHILISKMTIAAKWERSPARRKIFMVERLKGQRL
jgi:hypothetical protein